MKNFIVQSFEQPNHNVRVSPRHLGMMRRTDFCPRCFWYSIALGFRFPFEGPMPGIMFNMDALEKKLIDAHFKEKHAAPKWLESLKCAEPVDFPAKMTQDFPELGLTLVGMPDAVFRKKDRTLCVVDYKTARFKGADDTFMPGYETQLWGYAQLLEHYEVGTVSSAALVYFENTAANYLSKPLDLLTNDGLKVLFSVRIHEVEIDCDELGSLLKTFRDYVNMSAPPEGRDDCKACERLKYLFALENKWRNETKTLKDVWNRDASTLSSFIRQGRFDRFEAIVRQSRGWEAQMEDGMQEDADYLPAAWAL